MKKIRFYDRWLYRLFAWRFEKVLNDRPDFRAVLIEWLKAIDVRDKNEEVLVEVTVTRLKDKK